MVVRSRNAFSLIELLVVIAIIALLVMILVPSVATARELAKVATSVSEMRGISTALEMYALEHGQTYPPQRSWCSDDHEHSQQLPIELADGGYLAAGPSGSFRSAAIEDVFHPGYTYKYGKPGWGEHNDAVVFKSMIVPHDFPNDSANMEYDSGRGTTYDNVTTPTDAAGNVIPCPIRYALWSVGPDYDPNEGLPDGTPTFHCTWYSGRNRSGIIPLIVRAGGGIVTLGS